MQTPSGLTQQTGRRSLSTLRSAGCPAATQDSLPAVPIYREQDSIPAGSHRKVSAFYVIPLPPFPGFAWRKDVIFGRDSTGRAEIHDLTVFSVGVQEKKDDRDSHPSSFQVVAGARYVVEKKIPGRQVDFECLEGPCHVRASKPVLLAAA